MVTKKTEQRQLVDRALVLMTSVVVCRAACMSCGGGDDGRGACLMFCNQNPLSIQQEC